MVQTVQDVMTPNPAAVDASTPVATVATTMRDQNVGAVVLVEQGQCRGLVTDRDIVVRAVAEQRDLREFRIGDVASRDLVTASPDMTVEEAVTLMRDHAVRRLPVVDKGRPVGIVSIGDLAQDRDPHSALADISAAPANV